MSDHFVCLDAHQAHEGVQQEGRIPEQIGAHPRALNAQLSVSTFI